MTAAAMAEAVLAQWGLADESPSADEGNMVKMLAFLAAWRPCNCCGARVLYVDDTGRTDTQFVCGHCEERAEGELASAAVALLGAMRTVTLELLPPRS